VKQRNRATISALDFQIAILIAQPSEAVSPVLGGLFGGRILLVLWRSFGRLASVSNGARKAFELEDPWNDRCVCDEATNLVRLMLLFSCDGRGSMSDRVSKASELGVHDD
jgi:hypothetical protein